MRSAPGAGEKNEPLEGKKDIELITCDEHAGTCATRVFLTAGFYERPDAV